MSSVRLAVFFAFAVVMSGCTGELSRGKASSLLDDSEFFAQKRYLRFHDGMQFSLSDHADELATLIEKGLLRKQSRPKASGIFRYEDVFLTESGQAASAKWKNDGTDDSTGKNILLIPRGEMDADVTGVFHRSEVEALVDFKWRFVPNEYALADASSGNAVALFRRYDDGWRVVDVEKR